MTHRTREWTAQNAGLKNRSRCSIGEKAIQPSTLAVYPHLVPLLVRGVGAPSSRSWYNMIVCPTISLVPKPS